MLKKKKRKHKEQNWLYNKNNNTRSKKTNGHWKKLFQTYTTYMIKVHIPNK